LIRTLFSLALGLAITCLHLDIYAATEKATAAATAHKRHVAKKPSSILLRLDYADTLVKDLQWDHAIREYEAVLKLEPENARAILGIANVRSLQGNFIVEGRLDHADTLAEDLKWDQAISEYEAVLKLQPKNTRALLGIANVRRLQGNIIEAKRASEQASVFAPQNPDAQLGLAAVYVLDHDFGKAEKIYGQAARTWPNDSGVQQAAYDFRRQRNPRVYLYLESDLSFEFRQMGVVAPFAAQEEIGAEYQDETSIQPTLGNTRIYIRSDKAIFYTHYFGLNHMLDFTVRDSVYQHNETMVDYASIDTFQEYRIRYTIPLTLEQKFSVSYTPRPTKLKLTQEKFTAHKVETELNSHWTPRLATLLGIGWLRDLDSNATSTTQLTDRSLAKFELQLDATSNLSLSAKFITNPDLDNMTNSTLIAEGSYSLNDAWSALGRIREDDYKTGSNQTGYYLGARFYPNSHWWSEFGLKYATRGAYKGTYGMVSVYYWF